MAFQFRELIINAAVGKPAVPVGPVQATACPRDAEGGIVSCPFQSWSESLIKQKDLLILNQQLRRALAS